MKSFDDWAEEFASGLNKQTFPLTFDTKCIYYGLKGNLQIMKPIWVIYKPYLYVTHISEC